AESRAQFPHRRLERFFHRLRPTLTIAGTGPRRGEPLWLLAHLLHQPRMRGVEEHRMRPQHVDTFPKEEIRPRSELLLQRTPHKVREEHLVDARRRAVRRKPAVPCLQE